MSFVIGVSGPQGAGKSTILNELKSRGYYVDQFKVSRKVQADLGWTSLDRVLEDPRVMMDFQNLIFDEKVIHEKENQSRKEEFVLTERTFADIAAYSDLWAWKFEFQKKLSNNETKDYVSKFYAKCALAQNQYFAGSILVPWMKHMVFQPDKNRAKYNDINIFYTRLLSFLQLPTLKRHHILTVSAESVKERADQIENFLKGK